MTFLKTNILTLFSKVICLASSLFISIYIARAFGPSIKGTYYLLIQTVLILAAFSLFGLDSAVIYYLGKKKYSRKNIAIISNFLIVTMSLLMTLLLLGFYRMPFLHNALSELRLSYLFIIAFAMPFINISRLNSATLMGFNKFISFNILNIVLFLLMVLNFVVFVIILKMELFGALLSFLLSYLIMSIIYLIIVFRSKKIFDYALRSCERINVATLLGYGTRVFLVPILFLILFRIDSFLLSYYSSMSAVGFYSIALSFTELLLFIPESTGTILFPKLAYMSDSDKDTRFLFILRISMMLTFGIAALFFATIGYILPLVYGNTFARSVKLVHLLLPGMVAISVYYLFSSYFQAIGRPGVITIVLFVVIMVKTILCFVLIPSMNSSGVAIASTLSYLLCLLIFLSLFIMKSRFKLREIFILRSADINVIKNSLNNIVYFHK